MVMTKLIAGMFVTMIMLVLVMIVFVVAIAEMAQGHTGQVLHGHLGLVTATQHARQEGLHVRADPVQQVSITHSPYVGRAQRIVVRRSTGRQQHLGFANAVLHRCGDKLQRFDTGQHTHLGLGTGDEKQGKETEKTQHGAYSDGIERVI